MSDARVPRPRTTLMTAVILVVTTLWIAIRMPGTIHSFSDMFRAFGYDLPASTRLVLDLPYAWWVFPLLALPLGAWVLSRPTVTPRDLSRMKLATRALIVAVVAAFAFAFWALNGPMFAMSRAG